MTNYQRHGPHRAAIELNNVAISLLEKGFFVDAVATSEDAVGLMGSSLNLEESAVSPCTIALALERAHKRSALSDSLSRVPNNLSREGTHSLGLHVISTQHDPSKVYETLTQKEGTSKVSFPTRIEPYDFEHCTMNDVTFEFSVMLYNYGIVLESVAKCVTTLDSLSSEGFQRKAYHIYLCARALLFEVDQGNFQNAPIGLAGQILLVRTALSHNLLGASIELNLQHDYTEYCHAMVVLLTVVESQQAYLPISNDSVAPAA